jgi:Na+-transporting NADH:ubiquinone oxidoreductase subunit NqrB
MTFVTAVLLIFVRPQQVPLWAVLLGIAIFTVIVVSTVLF